MKSCKRIIDTKFVSVTYSTVIIQKLRVRNKFFHTFVPLRKSSKKAANALSLGKSRLTNKKRMCS